MMIKLADCVHVVNGISYDILELQALYEELKSYRRTRSLVQGRNSEISFSSTSPDIALQSQIMKFSTDKSKSGYDIGQHPVVQNLLNQFKIKINPDHVDINCFRPGFEFHPHTDQVRCTVMFPIIPLDTGAPIDFYYREGLEVKESTEYRYLTAKDRIIEYHYSDTNPSIINQRQIHGVRKLDHERVYLRFKIKEYSFLELVELDNQGQLTVN